MTVLAVHLGFHGTEEDRLARALLRDAAALRAAGIAVPHPAACRAVLGADGDGAGTDGAREPGRESRADAAARLLALAGTGPPPRRIVLAGGGLLCPPDQALGPGGLYPGLAERAKALDRAFAGLPWEAILGLRNPASFLPALRDLVPGPDGKARLATAAASPLSWVPPVRALRASLPDLPILVYCSEDLPLVWPELLRRMAGLPDAAALTGDADLLGSLLTPVGLATLAAYLRAQGPLTPDARRRLTTALLERYARPDALEVEVDLPGWTETRIAAVTADYAADVATIARLPGVRLLAP